MALRHWVKEGSIFILIRLARGFANMTEII